MRRSLEKARWPLPTLTVLASITAVAFTVFGMVSRARRRGSVARWIPKPP